MTALHFTADPNIALLLLVVGILGIYAEFCAPGLCVPGVAGSILVLLGITALSRFPIHWQGAVLMALGPVFFILEARYSTRGVLSAAGAFTSALGAVMLIDAGVRWATALALAIPFALISSFLFSVAFHARRNKFQLRCLETRFSELSNTEAGKS